MRNKRQIIDLSFGTKENISGLILVFLIFFLTSPYFFWRWYGNQIVGVTVTSLSLFLIWRHVDRAKCKRSPLFKYFILVWVVFVFSDFIRGARTGLIMDVPYLLFGFVPFVKKEFGRAVFHNFISFYAILIGLSMLFWVAAMTGQIAPIGQLGEGVGSFEKEGRSYLVYPFTLVSLNSIDLFTRFCAFYDEPGVVGTLAGLILCARRFDMKDWRCIIILLSGLLSTSMFFYGLTAVYWIAELMLIRKKYGLVFLLLASFSSFYVVTKDNAAVSYLVWERFEWDSSEGGFARNTREGATTDLLKERLNNTGEIWLGVKFQDRGRFWDEYMGLSSIYTVIAMYGIILVVFYLIWLLMIGNHYIVNKREFFLYCFAVVGCMYQRGNLFVFPYVYIITCIARYQEFQKPCVTYFLSRDTSGSAQNCTTK